MSMSMHVILGTVPTAADWQAAINAAGFNLQLDANLDTANNTGYVPVRFDDIESGFEFDCSSIPDGEPTFSRFLGANDTRRLSANFRWGGSVLEMCCAFAAASALAKFSGGVLFQAEDGTRHSGAEAIKAAKAEIAAADGMY